MIKLRYRSFQIIQFQRTETNKQKTEWSKIVSEACGIWPSTGTYAWLDSLKWGRQKMFNGQGLQLGVSHWFATQEAQCVPRRRSPKSLVTGRLIGRPETGKSSLKFGWSSPKAWRLEGSGMTYPSTESEWLSNSSVSTSEAKCLVVVDRVLHW